MDKKLKAKWVAALRSGEFKQTTGKLYRGTDDGGVRTAGYCCLGVLAKIQECELDGNSYEIRRGGIAFKDGDLLPEVLSGGMSKETIRQLADKNDSGAPFPEIADYIEANL